MSPEQARGTDRRPPRRHLGVRLSCSTRCSQRHARVHRRDRVGHPRRGATRRARALGAAEGCPAHGARADRSLSREEPAPAAARHRRGGDRARGRAIGPARPREPPSRWRAPRRAVASQPGALDPRRGGRRRDPRGIRHPGAAKVAPAPAAEVHAHTLKDAGEDVLDPVVSPSGGQVAYIEGRKLWIRDLTQLAFCARSPTESTTISGRCGPRRIVHRVRRRRRESRAWTWREDRSLRSARSPTLAAARAEPGTPTATCSSRSVTTTSTGSAAGGGVQSPFITPYRFARGRPPSPVPPAWRPRRAVRSAPGVDGTHRHQRDRFGNAPRSAHAGEQFRLRTRSTIRADTSIYSRIGEGTGLWAIPSRSERMAITGEQFLIASEGGSPSIAADGTLVYRLGTASIDSRVMVVDRAGVVRAHADGAPTRQLVDGALSRRQEALRSRIA